MVGWKSIDRNLRTSRHRHHRSHLSRDVVELGSRWRDRPIRIDAERVAGEPREDVQMSVKDLLERRFPVRLKEVDSLAAKSGSAQRLGEPHGDREHPRSGRIIQIGQVRSMPLRDD